MNRKTSDWAGNIAALVVVISVNAFANILRFAGTTTGEVSDKYFSLFTPAGFTFGIWSLIYLALLAFVVYQALPAQRSCQRLARISPWFKLGCGANALWMFAWHLEWIMVTVLLMLVLLFSLFVIYRSLGVVDATAARGDRWLVQLPFTIYLGWISVATIANLSAMQSALGWNDLGFDPVIWTLAKLAVAGAIAAVVVLRRHDTAFALVIAWAAYGISAGQAATPAVAGAAFAVCLLTLLLVAFGLLHRTVRR